MVTLLVIAHAEIANSMVKCIEHILAKNMANVHVISVRNTDSSENILNLAKEYINRTSNNNQVLILTDLFGATPSNIASKLLKPGHIEMITGLNLPMLLRANSYIGSDLHTCALKALEGAQNGIVYINGENI